MKRTAIKIGILGTCPVCEGEFKVREGHLVHHGFTRPGDGVIHGDCFAVGFEPYERSPKGCEDYKAIIASQLVSQEAYLKSLPTRTYFKHTVLSLRGELQTRQYILGVTNRYDWVTFVEGKTRETQNQIRRCESEIARMDRLISAWTLKDLREVTEEQAASSTMAEREARKAQKDAKDAVKNAKAEALRAKREARETKREAAFQAFIDMLTLLDTSKKPEAEKKNEAAAAWSDFFSKKNERNLGSLSDFIYAFRKQGHEDLLLRVGLAFRETSGFVRYTHW